MAGIQLLVELDDNGTPRIAKLNKELGHTGAVAQTAKGKFKSAFAEMARSADSVNRSIMGIANSIPMMIGAAGAGGALMMGAREGIKFNASLESIEATFKVLIGDATKAKAIMRELWAFAGPTPFQIEEVANAAKVLMASGIGGAEALRKVGDAAAFAQRPLDEVAGLMARLASGSFGEAFEQLRQSAIATKPMLEAEGLRFDKQGSYQGSAKEAVDAVFNIITKRFGGLTAEMGKTAKGVWSTVVDTGRAAMGALMSTTFDRFKPKLQEVADAFAAFASGDKAKRWADVIADAAENALAKIVGLAKGIVEFARANEDMIAVTGRAVVVTMGLSAAVSLVTKLFTSGWIGWTIAGVGLLVGWIWKASTQVGGWRLEWEKIKVVAMEATTMMRAKVAYLATYIAGVTKAIAAAFAVMWEGIKQEAEAKMAGVGLAIQSALVGNFAGIGPALAASIAIDPIAEAGARAGEAFGAAMEAASADAAAAASRVVQATIDARSRVEAIADVLKGGMIPPLPPSPTSAPPGEAVDWTGGGVVGGSGGTSGSAAEEARKREKQEQENALANQTMVLSTYQAIWTEMWGGYWGDVADLIGRGFSDVVAESILSSGNDLKARLDAVWTGIRDSFVRMTVDMATQWIVNTVKMKMVGMLFQKQATQDAVKGAAARIVASNAEQATAATEAATDTASAGAKTFKAHAHIPFVGAIIAAGLVAMMLASLSKLRAKRTGGLLEGGGTGIEDDQVFRGSGGEYVMPASRVKQYGVAMMDSIRAGTFGGGSGGGTLNLQITVPGGGSGDFSRDVEREIVPVLERLARQRRLNLRFAQ